MNYTISTIHNHLVHIPRHVGKGNQQHSQEILSKEKTEMEAFAEVWVEEKKKEKGIPDLNSGVQGQTVFMLHPLFSGKALPATEETGARWSTSHITHTWTHTYRR